MLSSLMRSTSVLAICSVTAGLLASHPAQAQSADQIGKIEREIQALQTELHRVKSQLSARDAEVRATKRRAEEAQASAQAAEAAVHAAPPVAVAAVAPPPPGLVVTSPGKGSIRIGGVTITVGGFIEAATIYRSRNETADIASNWSGIPFNNSVSGHVDEFRESARQSRVSLLAQAEVNPVTPISAYIEADFLGAAGTANSKETNSYNPRLRHAYLTAERTDWGSHFLAGQTWSLLTMSNIGMVPRKEDIPYTIDAQYVPGFVFTRQPQIRVWQDFADRTINVGLSVESPQAVFSTGPNGAVPGSAVVTTTTTGGSNFNSAVAYSIDDAPDIVAKATWDPGFGHYEAFGVARFLRSRISVPGSGANQTTVAGGGGLGAIVPIIGKKLLLQGSFLAGAGIGRYGAAQLPDATIGRDGSPVPLPEIEALIGIVGHPTPSLDLYAYVGTEQIGRRDFSSSGKGFGYGSPLYSNAGCETELASGSACVANTSGIVQGTLGFWWRYWRGDYGTMQVGAQYSYTHRNVFSGAGGSPTADENVGLLSFRYYPFQ